MDVFNKIKTIKEYLDIRDIQNFKFDLAFLKYTCVQRPFLWMCGSCWQVVVVQRQLIP